MSAAPRRIMFSCLLFVVAVLHAQSSPSVIRGKLSENGRPITEATVFLQSLDNEKCAKLFSSKKADPRMEKKLTGCMHDLGDTSPDATGNYQFAVPKAGWYAVHFLWDIGKKPEPQVEFLQGRWGVMYAGYKDSSGKYDTMAQDSPFYFTGKEDAIRDCDFHF